MLKPFLQWLAFTLVGFGSLSGGYHLYLKQHPSHVVVVLDSSFSMQRDLAQIRAALDEISNRRYADFSLYTEKGIVHGWRPRLSADNVTFYAPRDWSRLSSLGNNAEFSKANETILITNDPAAPNPPLDWIIVHLK
ncbi:MAG TPA: hypothetical protein VKA94_08390 [Hyphomicrobiales bacterium]|nr:hypothetical protein [Hyphomicrobiales bacterium]